MKNLIFDWKGFSINGALLLANMKMISNKVLASSHNAKLVIHAADDISEEEIQEIQNYWTLLDEESEEAISYIPGEQETANFQAEKQALLDSAKAKLLVLGLSEAEIAAFLGV